MEKGTQAAREIESTTHSTGSLVVRYLDLANFNSIREFAKDILTTETRINILVNNAGLMLGYKRTTVDGFDTVFQTNHLGPFLLTNLLLDKIKVSKPSRIINLTSIVHKYGKMHWNDLNMKKNGAYGVLKSYCQSKLANILFTKELAKKLQGTSVTVYAVDPGIIHTEFNRYFLPEVYPPIVCSIVAAMEVCLFNVAEDGAQTTIHCAVDEQVAHQTGLYYHGCREIEPSKLAMDAASATKLWDMCAEMVKLDEQLHAM